MDNLVSFWIRVATRDGRTLSSSLGDLNSATGLGTRLNRLYEWRDGKKPVPPPAIRYMLRKVLPEYGLDPAYARMLSPPNRTGETVNKAQRSVELIEFLREAGDAGAFDEAFPLIHHFNDTPNDASADGFYRYSKAVVKDFNPGTNTDVYIRLVLIKDEVDAYFADHPNTTISAEQFRDFAQNAVEAAPIR